MIRNLLFITGFLILLNCGSFQTQTDIRFKDGRIGTVFLEYQDSDSGEKILIADYTNEAAVQKESDIERDVIEIWSAVEKVETKEGVEEALLRYRYFTGHHSEAGKDIFEMILFTADLTESGKWSIKRVD